MGSGEPPRKTPKDLTDFFCDASERQAAQSRCIMNTEPFNNPDTDIHENDIQQQSPELLSQLLFDHTTGRNLLWCTHDYEHLGENYGFNDEILPELITGEHGMVIRPRVLKTKEEQTDRVKDMAEVFTPSWVVKMMVDNVEFDFDTCCMELTCGEAPFLVSRYDATTGDPIAIGERVGILDRKLRLINDQQLGDEDWLTQVKQAFQSTYGYEWQGDSLLLARENMLYTFVDYYEARFGTTPDITLLKEFAETISWNLWQMDGLSYRIPREKKNEPTQTQFSLFDDTPVEAPAPLCIIKDWQRGETIKVNDLKQRQTKNNDIMKFDVIIGNPPYQEERTGENKQFASPVYNYFIDESQKIGNIVELIHPARFLFNAGSTPKEWNTKMLNDEHFKILMFEQDSSSIFGNNIDIKGGVVVSYRNAEENYGAIKTFTSTAELDGIMHKVWKPYDMESLSSIIYIQNRFNLEALYKDYPDVKKGIGSDGRDSRLEKNIFVKVPIFTESRQNKDDIKVIGIFENARAWRYIPKQYIDFEHENINHYKIMIPVATGRGQLGETLSTPVIGYPMVAYTRSFIGIGAFDNEEQAESCLKYLKTKFCRTMLGVLKITQMNNKEVWRFVPLQDFTPSSDIDWSKSIDEIDEQLFEKYGLDEQERNFIRTKVKEMK